MSILPEALDYILYTGVKYILWLLIKDALR
jgi:hypothetical protein